MKIFLIISLFLSAPIYAFNLPTSYDSKTQTDFNISKNTNGTYNFYLKSFPDILLYQTPSYDLHGFSETICGKGNQNITGGVFNYATKKEGNLIFDTVFLNKKTKEISAVYPGVGSNFKCPSEHEIMADADNQYAPHVIFFHPIFKSQPKTWIIVPRKFNEWARFSNVDDSQPTFLENGNFRLVIEAEPETAQEMKPTKVETIPIDYSIFEKPVNKPTCYAMPENYKLRPCTFAEAKLRSPALKAFLGEA
jgi:hypothetical protein